MSSSVICGQCCLPWVRTSTRWHWRQRRGLARGAAIAVRIVDPVAQRYPIGVGDQVLIVGLSGLAVQAATGFFEVGDALAFFAVDVNDG